MVERERNDYIPALSSARLTSAYDPVLRWLLFEERYRQPLLAAAAVQPGERVLDVGCGTATVMLRLRGLCPEATIVGVDIDPAILMLAAAKAEQQGMELALGQASAEGLPFADGAFDTVISSLMVHHLTGAQKARMFAEVQRVLVDDGRFLLLDFSQPTSPAAQAASRPLHRFEHIDDNLSGRLPDLLHEAGFTAVDPIWRGFGGFLALWRAQRD